MPQAQQASIASNVSNYSHTTLATVRVHINSTMGSLSSAAAHPVVKSTANTMLTGTLVYQIAAHHGHPVEGAVFAALGITWGVIADSFTGEQRQLRLDIEVAEKLLEIIQLKFGSGVESMYDKVVIVEGGFTFTVESRAALTRELGYLKARL